MNKRAKQLGMKDTHFVNTNGLPVADHYTSAYDIATMSKELIKHTQTKDWFNTWQTTIKVGLEGKKQTELGLTNTNRLIKMYQGANGIKTGFTQDAGYCLSGSATRDGLTLIAVVLGCPSSKVRFAEVSKLLDYGFANYESVKIAEKGEPLGAITLEKATPSLIDAVAPENINVLVKKGKKDGIKGETELKKSVCAPVERGQKVGELVLYQNGKEISRYPLVAAESAENASWTELYIRMLKEGVR